MLMQVQNVIIPHPKQDETCLEYPSMENHKWASNIRSFIILLKLAFRGFWHKAFCQKSHSIKSNKVCKASKVLLIRGSYTGLLPRRLDFMTSLFKKKLFSVFSYSLVRLHTTTTWLARLYGLG